MKRFFLYTALGVLLIPVVVSCNNNEEINDGIIVDGKVSATKGIQFSLSLSDYNEEQDVDASRVIASDTVHEEAIDLGNGMSAEITVQRDRTKSNVATRVMPNGTYTMLAYDASKNLKGSVTGTVTGGIFTPTSSNSDIYLEPGNYEFVCYNDKVTRNGNNLIVTRANAEGALIGREPKTITATPKKQTVLFDMRHVASRIRIQLIGWMNFPAVSASLESTGSMSVPTSAIYDASLGNWTTGAGGSYDENITFPASPTTPSSNNEFRSINNEYLYFTPQLDISKLKITLKSGQIYRISMNGASLALKALTDPYGNKTTTSPQTAYLINVRLTCNFLYLMSDGSTGFFQETTFGGGAKTPIGVVVSQSKRMAVALENAGNRCKWTTNILYNNNPVTTDPTGSLTEMLTRENGYEETWDGNYSNALVTGEKVKGKNTDFPAFKTAADYTPGVAVTGTMVGKKWYLPAIGEWKYVFTALGFGDITQMTDWVHTYNWYGYLANVAFTQVGSALTYGGTADYWSATEINMGACFFGPSDNSIMWYGVGKSNTSYVRPFIRY